MGNIKKQLLKVKRKAVGDFINPMLVRDKTKVFCIGANKTGTTSLKQAFEDLGFIVGNQRVAEKLTPYYFNGNFNPIIKFCRLAQVFQDIPFSYPQTYKHLDESFSGSKFILTIRDNSEQWYNSVVSFHSKLFGQGNIPSSKQLEDADYVWKGWMYDNIFKLYNTPQQSPYHKETLIRHYEQHNADVVKYFSNQKESLLIINLTEKDAYSIFCRFIGVHSPFEFFPWENKTDNIIAKK